MAAEGEGKLVVGACQDCNEMRFEDLDGTLRLVLSVVARWHELKLDFLLADILLERIGCFVIQRVLFIPSPAILILLIIFSYALIISSFFRLRIGSMKI